MDDDFTEGMDTKRRMAIVRANAVRPLIEAGLTGTELAKALAQVAARLNVSSRTARRIFNRLLDGDSRASAVEPIARGPKIGSRRLVPEIEAFIAAALEERYLRREKVSFLRVVEEIQLECKSRGWQPPTRKTVQRRLDAMDRRKAMLRRHGSKLTREAFMPIKTGFATRLAPLQMVQIDHTLADVILVDTAERKPFRRPWVTLAIDVATRMITGRYVTFDSPSVLSLSMCLEHSVKSKQVASASQAMLDWPAFGLPTRIHVDNGQDFRSKAFVNACAEWGVQLSFRPPGRPHHGGHIERLIGTTMGAVHLLPGSTDSNPLRRGDYDSAAHASLTLHEFECWLDLEVCRYHNAIHSSLDTSPLSAWHDRKDEKTLRLPNDVEAFRLSFLPEEKRKLRRNGVTLFGITYWSDLFAAMIARSEDPYVVKYDPRDLSKVWLQVDGNRMIEARYRDLSRPAISIWEHRDARRRARDIGRRTINENLLFEIIIAQRRLTREASRNTKEARMERERTFRSRQTAPKKGAGDMFAIDTADPTLPTFPIEDL